MDALRQATCPCPLRRGPLAKPAVRGQPGTYTDLSGQSACVFPTFRSGRLGTAAAMLHHEMNVGRERVSGDGRRAQTAHAGCQGLPQDSGEGVRGRDCSRPIELVESATVLAHPGRQGFRNYSSLLKEFRGLHPTARAAGGTASRGKAAFDPPIPPGPGRRGWRNPFGGRTASAMG